MLLINVKMLSQFVALYKYGNTVKWGPAEGGGGIGGVAKPNNPVLIPDIYFVFTGSGAQFLL